MNEKAERRNGPTSCCHDIGNTGRWHSATLAGIEDLKCFMRQTGQVYQYFDVPAQEYVAFLQAESKGTHLKQSGRPPVPARA